MALLVELRYILYFQKEFRMQVAQRLQITETDPPVYDMGMR